MSRLWSTVRCLIMRRPSLTLAGLDVADVAVTAVAKGRGAAGHGLDGAMLAHVRQIDVVLGSNDFNIFTKGRGSSYRRWNGLQWRNTVTSSS